MAAFPGVADQVRADMHLHRHFRYFLREARVTAYAQVRAPAARIAPVCSSSPRGVLRLRSSWSRTRA